MTHSFAESTTLTCPACRRPYPVEIWLIVDTAERPDLLARLQTGSLHDIPCPHCRHSVTLDAPLLIYRPGQTPPILFSPAEQTTSEQDQAHAIGLINLLRDRLGTAWQDAWLAQGLNGVPRQMLPAALSDDPQAALRELQARAQAEIERLQREDPAAYARLEQARREAALRETQETGAELDGVEAGEEREDGQASLFDALDQFVRAETWDESQRIVEQHPELLSDDADALFSRMTEAARAQADDRSAAMFEEHRDLLRRCREAGVPRAFAEKMLPPEGIAEAGRLGLAPEEFLAQMRAAKQMPSGLREVLVELAASGIEIHSAEDLERALAERPDLRARLEAAMPDHSGGFDIPPEFSGDLRQAQEAEQRYRRTNNQTALDAAAAAWEHILGHPAFPAADARFQLAAMNNAGGVFLRRYWSRGRLADLNRALDLWQTAVQRTPPDSPDLPGYLNNLGNGLRARYARTGQLADLAEAIRVYEQAVQRTPPDSPDLPGYLNNLGAGLSDRYARTGQLADLAEAQNLYRRACTLGLTVASAEALRSARNWGNWALARKEWEEATTAYEFGRRAMDQLFQGQIDRAAKESWLKEAQGLPANAAYALAQLDRLPEAIEALEQGRARLLAEALEQNRRDLERLPALGHPNLYARYRAASDRLTALQQQAGQPAGAGPDHPAGLRDYAAWRQELEAARGELNAAIAAIRGAEVDGQQPYADFLQPATFARITAAVQPGALLVYLLTTTAGSLALILHRPNSSADLSVNQVWLNEFTASDLETLLVERQGDQIIGGYLPGQLGDHAWLAQHLDEALATLGNRLIGPLAAALRRGPFHDVRARQRALILVPAGRLSLLPLHAARYPVNGAARRFLDDFTVTYAPSLMTLADVQARPRDAGSSLLAIGNPLPATHPAWFTDWLAQEVAAAHPGGALLLHDAATTAAVDAAFAAAPGHVLFACHGGFDPAHPLASGLELADGPQQPYTVRHLLDNVRFGAAPLVTLCACQTSITDFNSIPDEAVGLPAAFLQAGARNVVATFWSVEALPTVLLVRQFYQRLIGGSPAEVALREAIAWLRSLDAFPFQVELASMRRVLSDRAAFALDWQASRLDGPAPFAAPVYWAAFACHGPLTA